MHRSYLYAFLTALFWGAGFIGSRFALEALGPLWVCFFRFFIAFMGMAPLAFFVKLPKISSRLVKGSFVSAIFLSLLIAFQIAGLQYTTIAKSSFITMLYAFLVPIVSFIVFKKRIRKNFWFLLMMAAVGMLFLSEFQLSHFNYGDFLTLLCAVATCVHILVVSHYSREFDGFTYNLLQLFFVALICLPLALTLEGLPALSQIDETSVWLGLIFMGLFSTSLAFYFQVKAQEKVPSHLAGLIFLLESPVGAILGLLVFKEALSGFTAVGCLLILLSVALISIDQFQVPTMRLRIGLTRSILAFKKILSIF